ncbi:MAG: hypothetical protein A3G25_19055 [Betaproteobacteria bacterium RIFCSPLOWO2_12_FULL_63_13]|nr:MAG: hypothetical protein A3G25_19055 [Betaproteobacteria bacterium RIFCSPLOWO2_12_FULL_63_13]
MEPLPLAFVGWFYTLACAAALGTGAVILYGLRGSGGLGRRYAEERLLNDLTLFAIWTAGLIGGTGVLRGKSWSLWLLEFFCWTLCAMVILSGANRVIALKRAAVETRGGFAAAVAGIVLVSLPILAFCAATIVTLRSDSARQALAG